MRITSLVVALLVGFTTISPVRAETNRGLLSALDSIKPAEIGSITETLAADSFEGREAGARGGRAAATYIMKQLQAIGMTPAGSQGTYFQPFGGGYRNILAVLPGSDPRLRDEYILVSAHYDHVGYGNRATSNGPVGYIHNGADDNASGVASVLELAEALQQLAPGLARSVLFIWWDAEEKGLWGSKYWLNHPTVPLGQMKLMINVDMVGRLRGALQLYGTRSMPGLRARWSQANLDPNLYLQFPWHVLDNSDHFPFFQRNVPITMLHTGLHDDYHRPSDDAGRLNVAGIADATQLLLRFTVDVANTPSLATFRHASKSESDATRRRFEASPGNDKPKLGVSWRTAESVTAGLRITRVWSNSIAERAGIRVGDRITHVGDRPVQSGRQFRRTVAASFGDESLTLVRSGNVVQVTASFGGTPPRVGVTWRTSTAEPRTVVITSVTPGFPAERAGIQALDRIHQVNDRPLLSADDFHDRMLSMDGAVELLIERQGQLRKLVLELPTRETSLQ